MTKIMTSGERFSSLERPWTLRKKGYEKKVMKKEKL